MGGSMATGISAHAAGGSNSVRPTHRSDIFVVAAVLSLASQPASADWRTDLGTFRIGIVASKAAGDAVLRLAAIKSAYSDALGVPVEVFFARDYAALIDAQATARIDYAVHTALSYAATWQLCACIEPIAAPVGGDGAIGIRSALIVRKGTVAGADALVGRTIALGPADSVAGAMLPLAEFQLDGKPLSGDEAFIRQVGSASEAEDLFAAGSIDGLFGWATASPDAEPPSGTVARLVAGGIASAEMNMVWTSDLVPYGPHAVRTNLAPAAKAALKDFLLGLKTGPPELHELLAPAHNGGFAEIAHDAYLAAIAITGSEATRAVAD
jgi:phosphonate transport system substrate-binding protein